MTMSDTPDPVEPDAPTPPEGPAEPEPASEPTAPAGGDDREDDPAGE
jgi:hypothetical protein